MSERFNPRRDLFLFATHRRRRAGERQNQFQSQAGFVPLCDRASQRRNVARLIVSIPGGICSSLRRVKV